MKIKTFVIGYVFALAIFLFAQHRTTPEKATHYAVIDLTHAIDNQNAPSDVGAAVRQEKTGYLLTHIDAPALLDRRLWTVDQIPAERLIAPYAVLDVSKNASKNPDYEISVVDIADWEQLHGHIPQGSVVIAHTGWDSRWNSITYRNADATGTMHFPGYSAEAARFLVEGRNIIGLGIDTLRVDRGSSKDLLVHRYASSHSIYQLENVTNLAQVPEAGGTLVVAPSKVEKGISGAPVRLLAMAR